MLQIYFLPFFLCLCLNVFLPFSFWQKSPLSRARKFTIATSKSNILETTVVSGALTQEMQKRLTSFIVFYVDFSSYIMTTQDMLKEGYNVVPCTAHTDIAKFLTELPLVKYLTKFLFLCF